MAWTNLTVAFGSLLTSTKMTQLFDDLTALANGDTGAPNVQTAGLANLAVTAAKIANDTITGTQVKKSGTITSQIIAASGNWLPPAGVYLMSDESAATAYLSFFVGGGVPWTSAGASISGIYYFDGVNVRIVNSDSSLSLTIRYIKFV